MPKVIPEVEEEEVTKKTKNKQTKYLSLAIKK